MTLTPQAKILAVILVVSQIVTLVSSFVTGEFILFTIMAVTFALLFIALIVYDTNCLVTGGCKTWSWIRTIVYSLLIVWTVVLTLWVLIQSRKLSKQVQQELQRTERFADEVKEEKETKYKPLSWSDIREETYETEDKLKGWINSYSEEVSF